MLFEMRLMQFDANGLIDAGPFLAPFCFSLFILLVVFVCMSMFFTIINDNFRTVRDNAKLNGDKDQSIYLFMFYKFQCWLGIGKSIKLKQMEEQDEQMRWKYFHPVENFPEKIDQLLEALNRVRWNNLVFNCNFFMFSFIWIRKYQCQENIDLIVHSFSFIFK
jgi:hypothetical protein